VALRAAPWLRAAVAPPAAPYIPPPRPNAVRRPRLTERLTEGLHRKLTP
jgi:ATP/maltotriose-dependent transcriptional regulator MalT